MEMLFAPRYHSGDQVYVIEYNGGGFKPSLPMIVNEVRIRITSYGTYITYHLIDGGLSTDYHEKDCYATREECLKQCEFLKGDGV